MMGKFGNLNCIAGNGTRQLMKQVVPMFNWLVLLIMYLYERAFQD